MKRSILMVIVVAGLTVTSLCSADAKTGEALFAQHCNSCHGQAVHPRVAPPVNGIRQHLLKAHPDQEAFVAYVVKWLQDPNPDNALMSHAVERFGAMPKPAVTDAEARLIAEFLYDTASECPGCSGQHQHQQQQNQHQHQQHQNQHQHQHQQDEHQGH